MSDKGTNSVEPLDYVVLTLFQEGHSHTNTGELLPHSGNFYHPVSKCVYSCMGADILIAAHDTVKHWLF